MKYLNRVRKPETQPSLQSKLLMIAGALLLGVCLGTVSKYLDYRQAALPGILQQIDASLDLLNFSNKISVAKQLLMRYDSENWRGFLN